MLKERMGELIQRHHGGNVNAAAKRIRIAQPTLRDIVIGKSENPKRETLEKIASSYGVSVDWLLGTSAAAPAPPARPASVAELLARIEEVTEGEMVRILARESLAAVLDREAALTRARALEGISRAIAPAQLPEWEPGEAARLLHRFLERAQQALEGEEPLRPTG
jgi:transcriptional regulator with XRE-family HTH domain